MEYLEIKNWDCSILVEAVELNVTPETFIIKFVKTQTKYIMSLISSFDDEIMNVITSDNNYVVVIFLRKHFNVISMQETSFKTKCYNETTLQLMKVLNFSSFKDNKYYQTRAIGVKTIGSYSPTLFSVAVEYTNDVYNCTIIGMTDINTFLANDIEHLYSTMNTFLTEMSGNTNKIVEYISCSEQMFAFTENFYRKR